MDFGALIDIDPSRIVPARDRGTSESHCAVGTIRYLDGTTGTLLYIKSSMTGDEPEDVLEYHANQAQFPHESTADQWFEESQFESYRALGYHAAHSALVPAELRRELDGKPASIDQMCEDLRNNWYPMNPHLRGSATRLTERLADLLQMIQSSPGLHDLGAKLFPNSGIPPAPVADRVAEFYFCMSLLQLVEDVYFEFELDREQWRKGPQDRRLASLI